MDSPHPTAFQAEQLNPGVNETRNKLKINYKLRQEDFKIEYLEIIHFPPPVTLNMFRLTVWTISTEAL